MAMVEFKFNIGDKVYLADELKPDVALQAKSHIVEALMGYEIENKYLLKDGHDGWIPEEDLISACDAKSRAISNCHNLIDQIAAREFNA